MSLSSSMPVMENGKISHIRSTACHIAEQWKRESEREWEKERKREREKERKKEEREKKIKEVKNEIMKFNLRKPSVYKSRLQEFKKCQIFLLLTIVF